MSYVFFQVRKGRNQSMHDNVEVLSIGIRDLGSVESMI